MRKADYTSTLTVARFPTGISRDWLAYAKTINSRPTYGKTSVGRLQGEFPARDN